MGTSADRYDLPHLLVAAVAATDTPLLLADAVDPGRPIIWVNPAFEAASGFTAGQLLGRNATVLQGPGTSPAAVDALREALDAGRPFRGRLLNYRPDGATWWNEMHISPVRDAAGVLTHFIGVQHDISDQVLAEDRAEHAATHDGLTGLVNRASFIAQLERELGRSSRDQRAVAVLFLDVDGLKEMNDTYGHAAGDVLLTEVGQRLTNRLRGEDLVARLGGDEFLALVVDLTGDGAKAAARVVTDLAAALSRPFSIDATTHRVRLSIGLALYPRDGSSAAELIAAADAAMYVDKASGDRSGAVLDPDPTIEENGVAARPLFVAGEPGADLDWPR